MTESMNMNQERYRGFIDDDYFKIDDNESSSAGNAATVEGKITQQEAHHTVIQLTITPTTQSIIMLIALVVMIVVLIVLIALSIIPLNSLLKGKTLMLVGAIAVFLLAIWLKYYSLKGRVVRILRLEKQRKAL